MAVSAWRAAARDVRAVRYAVVACLYRRSRALCAAAWGMWMRPVAVSRRGALLSRWMKGRISGRGFRSLRWNAEDAREGRRVMDMAWSWWRRSALIQVMGSWMIVTSRLGVERERQMHFRGLFVRKFLRRAVRSWFGAARRSGRRKDALDAWVIEKVMGPALRLLRGRSRMTQNCRDLQRRTGASNKRRFASSSINRCVFGSSIIQKSIIY